MQSRTVREWTLHEVLGQGGMGIVYRATHELLRGEYAVKVLRPELVGDGEARRRFVQEAANAAGLRHPNIVRCEVPFVEAGTVHLPMERLRGRTLAGHLEAQPGCRPWTEAVALVRQAALGLGYAHRQGLLHRDVKPANLWVEDGEPPGVKVLDFGLGNVAGERSLTTAGQFVGTPAYVAPEVLHGERPTAAADVYALGVVLFRLLAGRLPVELPDHVSSPAAMVLHLVKAHERGLQRVSSTGATVPAWLDELVARMLSASAADRPADGDAVAAALVAAPRGGRGGEPLRAARLRTSAGH